MHTRFPLKAVVTTAVFTSLASLTQGAIVNLTTLTDNRTNNTSTSQVLSFDTVDNTPSIVTGGIINDAYFINGSVNSGAGSSRALYRVKNNGQEAGYNRPGVFDATVLGGTSHIISKSDLITTEDGNYYIFSLDLNEGGSTYLSLDEFRIYAGSADPATLPTTEANLSALGTLYYNMNESEENHVLIEAGVSGSGNSDLYVFVPTASLAGAAASDQIYLYSAFGEFRYTGEAASSKHWEAGSGDEEWSIPTTTSLQPRLVPVTTVPEPSSSMLLLGGFVGFLMRRKR